MTSHRFRGSFRFCVQTARCQWARRSNLQSSCPDVGRGHETTKPLSLTTHRLLSSSFLGLLYRIQDPDYNRSLWVSPQFTKKMPLHATGSHMNSLAEPPRWSRPLPVAPPVAGRPARTPQVSSNRGIWSQIKGIYGPKLRVFMVPNSGEKEGRGRVWESRSLLDSACSVHQVPLR